MGGLTCFKTTSETVLLEAVEVVDPFHAVKHAVDALDTCRQRVQQETTDDRGRTGAPTSGARRALRLSRQFLTDRQRERNSHVSEKLEYAEVEATSSM